MKRKYSILTLFTLFFVFGVTLFFCSAAGEAASSLDKIDVAETEQKLEIAKTGERRRRRPRRRVAIGKGNKRRATVTEKIKLYRTQVFTNKSYSL